MDAHKTKIVEKLVKVLCLVLDTPDTKKMNITSMFDEKEFGKGDKFDISKKHLSLPKKDEKEGEDLFHFDPDSKSSSIKSPKKDEKESEDLFHLSPDIKSPPIKPSTFPKKDMKGEQDLFHISPESGVKSPPIEPVPSESSRPTTENPSSLKLFGSPPEKPVHTGPPVPLDKEPPGNALNTAKLEDTGPNFPPPPGTGGGRRRYKRRSVRSGAKPKKRSKKKSNKKSKRINSG